MVLLSYPIYKFFTMKESNVWFSKTVKCINEWFSKGEQCINAVKEARKKLPSLVGDGLKYKLMLIRKKNI